MRSVAEERGRWEPWSREMREAMSLGEGSVEGGVTLPLGVVVEEREVLEGLGERMC